jgi:hypothetical protein
MSKVILYPEGNEVRVLHPKIGRLSLTDIARKDVPSGVPYLIVDSESLPPEVNYRSALSADFSSPDGTGVGPEQWWAEQQGFPQIGGE